MAIDPQSVDQTNDASALLINRTGIMVHPELSAELIQGVKEITPASEDGEEIRIERSEYVAEASPIGSYPSAVNGGADEQVAEPSGNSEIMAFLFDKLSERLAFERQGTRLYEAFIQKLEALPMENGEGPEVEEVRHICEEELEHFKLLQKAIVELGGDATVQSPSADVAGVLSHGAMQIMTDPRTTVTQALQAVLTAELTDNDGWEMLQQLAEQLGYDDLAAQSGEALDQEREHLDSVRTWISNRMTAELAATGESGGQSSSAHADEEGKPRRRTAKKKASRSKSKRKKK
jgi:hypothetical protein